MLKRVPAASLKTGMFIHSPEGSWMNYPDWKTRFLLDDSAECQALKDSGIAAFIIDTDKGADAEPLPATRPRIAAAAKLQAKQTVRLDRIPQPRTSAVEEFARAEAIVGRARDCVADIVGQARLGKAVDLAATLPIIEEITLSVERNSSALISFARIKAADEYTYLHSVAVCALMINLGRQLLFDEAKLAELGMAGLMHDIGKVTIPNEVLLKPGQLSPQERAIIRQHPFRGADIMRKSKAPDVVLDVCLHHHERVDGRGYPYGLTGDKFSLPARMGAVCDVYDAITSRRPYKDAMQADETLAQMFATSGHFDESVLAAFIRSVGIYPIGSLVRLRSNRLAVVSEQNPVDLTKPVVRAFYSIADRRRLPPADLDLATAEDEIQSKERPEKWGFQEWDTLWSQLLRGDGRTRLSAAA